MGHYPGFTEEQEAIAEEIRLAKPAPMQIGEDGRPQVNTMLPFAQLQAQIQMFLAWEKAQTKKGRENEKN